MNYRDSNPDERTAALDDWYSNAEHEFELREIAADEQRDELREALIDIMTPVQL